MKVAVFICAAIGIVNAQLPGVQWDRERRGDTTTTTEEPVVATEEPVVDTTKKPVVVWTGFNNQPPPPPPPPPPPVVASPPTPFPTPPPTPVETAAPPPPASRPEPDSSDPIAISTGTVAFAQVDYTSDETVKENLAYITNVEQIMSTGEMTSVAVEQAESTQSNTLEAIVIQIGTQKANLDISREQNLLAVFGVVTYPDGSKTTINLYSAVRRARERRDVRRKRQSGAGLYEVTYYYVYETDASSDASSVSNVPAPEPEPADQEPDRNHKATSNTADTGGKGGKGSKAVTQKTTKKAKSQETKYKKAKDGKKTKKGKGLMSEQKATQGHKTRLITASTLTGFTVFAVLAVTIHRFRSKAAPSAESYALLPADDKETGTKQYSTSSA